MGDVRLREFIVVLIGTEAEEQFAGGANDFVGMGVDPAHEGLPCVGQGVVLASVDDAGHLVVSGELVDVNTAVCHHWLLHRHHHLHILTRFRIRFVVINHQRRTWGACFVLSHIRFQFLKQRTHIWQIGVNFLADGRQMRFFCVYNKLLIVGGAVWGRRVCRTSFRSLAGAGAGGQDEV